MWWIIGAYFVVGLFVFAVLQSPRAEVLVPEDIAYGTKIIISVNWLIMGIIFGGFIVLGMVADKIETAKRRREDQHG